MTRPPARTLLERIERSLRARLAKGGEDGGFMLVEVMIALSLITVIMAAVGVEYVSGLANTAHQRALVNATQAASTAINEVRALQPTDLLTGRTKAAVTTERTALLAIPQVAKWISSQPNRLAYNDTNNTSYATSKDNGGSDSTVKVAVPTVATVVNPAAAATTQGTTSFKVYRYIECSQDSPEVANPKQNLTDPQTYQRNCSPASRTNDEAAYLRVIVAAVWTDRYCPSGGCTFVTSTQIDGHANPTFDLNQPLPAAPVANNPGNQTVAVGDTVSLQLTVQDNTGVLPFTWAQLGGSLPAGLSLSPSGLISGTVQGSAAAATAFSVQVTDAFIRTDSTSFTWTVLNALVFNPIGNQANALGTIPTITLGASGGAGAPYTYTDPDRTLPTGLVLSPTGLITGTATVLGTYTVTLTVADKSLTRKVTQTFIWRISALAIIPVTPSDQSSTVGKKITDLQLSATRGTAPYTWSNFTGLPAGLTASSSGKISGTPTSATNGAVTVSYTVTDKTGNSSTDSFKWTVFAAPTIRNPGNQTSYQGSNVSLTTDATCPNTACTYSLANAPQGIVINPSTGKISGTPTNSSTTSTNVTITVTDSAGVSATTSPFTWTIIPLPTVSTALSTFEDTARNATPSIPITWTCPNAPCSLVLSGSSPDGIGLSTSPAISASRDNVTRLDLTGTSGTVYYTGKVDSDATVTTTRPVLTITDAGGATGNEADSWDVNSYPYVTAATVNGTNVTVARNATISVPITTYCNALLGSCRVELSGAPSGIGLSDTAQTTTQTTSSLAMSATAVDSTNVTGKVANTAATAGTYLVKVKVTRTNLVGTVSVCSSYAVWTVT